MSRRKSLPYMRFYPDDYISSLTVLNMTWVQRGIYMHLLCYAWKHNGDGLPSMDGLHRLCPGAKTSDIQAVLDMGFVTEIDQAGVSRTIHRRIADELQKVHDTRASISAAAKLRENKKRGCTDVSRYGHKAAHTPDSIHQTTTTPVWKKEKMGKEAAPIGFDEFYAIYPKKQGKADAMKAWKKVRAEEVPVIMAAVSMWAKSPKWQENDGQFIPMPATWLNGRRWEDVLEPTSKKQAGRAVQMVVAPPNWRNHERQDGKEGEKVRVEGGGEPDSGAGTAQRRVQGDIPQAKAGLRGAPGEKGGDAA